MELISAHSSFTAEDLDLVNPAVSVARRRSPGGGSFESVAAQLVALRQELASASAD
jgi:hypothetical protein